MTKSICLFNHKGGVSKTTTAFNLGWGLAELGKKVLMVDLDSQCNLSGVVLGYGAIDDEKMDAFYLSRNNLTMRPIVDFLINGGQPENYLNAESGKVYVTKHPNLSIIPGHLDVSDLDSQISVSLKIASGIPATRNIPGNLPRLLQLIAQKENVDYVLYDLSPNVGGLNEVVLMSSDYFLVPTSPDFFCWQAVGSLTKNIQKWHKEINRFKEDNGFANNTYAIRNAPQFIGTIQQRYRPRNDKPAKSFQNWIDKIRDEINTKLIPAMRNLGCVVDGKKFDEIIQGSGLAAYDIAHIADFNSLIAISQQLSKPVFSLSDSEIKDVGNVFGYALETMKSSRDDFLKTFQRLAKSVEALTR